MTDVIADPPSDQPPTLARNPRRLLARLLSPANPWMPVLVGVGVSLVASLTWLQWWHPYIEHDDWDMLLRDRIAFVEDHSMRLLYEGRWLNQWWWDLGSQHLTPREAALLYAAGWLIVVAVVVRSFSIRWWSVPAVAAIYAAPMMSMLSYWPATLAAPMWALALTVSLLWLTRDRWILHLATLVVGMIVISLGYPPFTLLLLPFLVALHHRKTWLRLTLLAGTFVLAYGAGILVVFTLNDIHFGVFGLKIQQWRNPSALNGLPSLRRHLSTVGHDWGAILRPATLPLLACLAALIAALTEPQLRRRLLILTLALLGAAGLSASPTITKGVNVPDRAMAWFWPFIVLVAAWGLEAVRPRGRAVAAVALTFIGVWSALYSAYAILGHQSDREGLNTLRAAIAAQQDKDPDSPIVFALPSRRPTPAARQAVWEAGNALAKLNGIIWARTCVGCRLVPGSIDPRHPNTWVFDYHGATVIQLPTAFDLSGLHADLEPSWLVPFR